MRTELGRHSRHHASDEEAVYAKRQRVARLVAGVRRCVGTELYPRREQQQTAQAQWSIGERCKRWVGVQQLRDDLQSEVAACRVDREDELRWLRASVEEVLDGREGLAQLFWEGVFGYESWWAQSIHL